MSAGIPIVPIVIRNAEVIAARDSSTFNPGTVDVAVFPPIPVDDWTPENLSDRIAEIRQLYLDTLRLARTTELPEPPDAATSGAKTAPAKKAPAKKAPAKKAAAKKAPAKKAPAKKAAKKAPAKKAPAKKATTQQPKKAPPKKRRP